MVPRFVEALSNSLEDVERYCQEQCAMSLKWVPRHIEMVYEERWITKAKAKDTVKNILKLIIAKDKQWLVWG